MVVMKQKLDLSHCSSFRVQVLGQRSFHNCRPVNLYVREHQVC
jgi:hypothetical protein